MARIYPVAGGAARRARRLAIAGLCLFAGAMPVAGRADDEPPASDAAQTDATPPDASEFYSLHGQFTNVTQYHPSFTSPYRGPNSLDPGNRGDETIDLTLFAGLRIWSGGEVYVNPEMDQGFGISNTLGVAGYPSGEAYKVGQAMPYGRLHRAFFRQTIDLGGADQPVDSEANQLAGSHTENYITVTLGKFSVPDIFDTNSYAHDPKTDFLNWALIDAGAFDYAADSWGYSYGGTVEWTQSWWTLRGGVFDLSREPNSKRLTRGFGQYAVIVEGEERHVLFGHPGKVKILGFENRGEMASYRDAIRLAEATNSTPDVALVRHFASRPGLSVNAEQEILDDLGAFARASINDGNKEAFEFTEINQSFAGGVSMKGPRWGRPDDEFGVAGVVNGLSGAARTYFAAGGLGILIGDGQLPHYGLEKILETYYSFAVVDHLTVSADYQYIVNPAYSPDRGPVSVFGFRLHAEI